MRRNKAILSILVTPLLFSLTSCNKVEMQIKSKGEEVKPLEFADNFMAAYENNLNSFNDKLFVGYASPEQLNTSFTVTYKTVQDKKITSKSIEQETQKTSEVTIKGESERIYDKQGIYSIKKTLTESKSTQNQISYSNESQDALYQLEEDQVCFYNKKDETYYVVPNATTVKNFALNDECLIFIYNMISSVYASIALAGNSFGVPLEGDNTVSQYYQKGNVFTVISTISYADTILDKASYANIQGNIQQTRQYILEKNSITYTKYTEYKKVSWKDVNNDYMRTLENEEGVSYKLTLKGSQTKVSNKNYTEINYPNN